MPSFFFVLVAILLASTADSLFAAENLGARPLFWLALAALAPIFLGEALRAARNRPDSPGRRLLLGFFVASPLGLYAALLFLAGWTPFAKQANPWNLETTRFLFLFFPYLLLKATQWTALSRLEKGAEPPTARPVGPALRLFLFAVLPVLLFLGATDLLAHFRETRILLASVGLARFAATVIFFFALVLVLPMAARCLWATKPLPPGPLRERLEAAAKRFRFRCRDILVWDTGERSVNAAILGLFPRFRFVILTDGLISSLEPAEVEGVFGHELGHALRHHVAVFFGYVLGMLLLLLAVSERWLGESVWGIVVALAYLGMIWGLIGAISRRFELEADLYGAGATGDPMTFIGALEKVGAYSGRGRWHGSWRHFSVAERVYFLMHEASDPKKLARFERKIRVARWGGALCLLAAAGLHAALLLGDLPVDLAERHLRRGEFQEAHQRIFPVRFESERTKALFTIAETGIGVAQENPQDWRERLAPRGRDLFLEKRFSAAYYHLALAELLEIGGDGVAKLAHAALLLARNDDEGLNEFIRFGEGRSLLEDLEIFKTLYPQ